MANIRIEKNESSSILPWVLGLLLLGLVVWGVAEAFEETADDEVAIVDEYDDEIADRAAYIEAEEDMDDADYDDAYITVFTPYIDYTENMEGEMGLDHEFSHEALTRLANATAAVAEARDVDNVEANSKAMRAKQLADEITKDPLAGNHADKIRMAALLITEVLEDVDARTWNSVNADELAMLRESAQAINGEPLALDQKEDIRDFFSKARTVLLKMS